MVTSSPSWAGPNLPGYGGPYLPVTTEKRARLLEDYNRDKTAKFILSFKIHTLNFVLAIVQHKKTELIHMYHKFSVSSEFYSRRGQTHRHCPLPEETEEDSGNSVGCTTKCLLPVGRANFEKNRQTSTERRWPIPPGGPYLPVLPYLYNRP